MTQCAAGRVAPAPGGARGSGAATAARLAEHGAAIGAGRIDVRRGGDGFVAFPASGGASPVDDQVISVAGGRRG